MPPKHAKVTMWCFNEGCLLDKLQGHHTLHIKEGCPLIWYRVNMWWMYIEGAPLMLYGVNLKESKLWSEAKDWEKKKVWRFKVTCWRAGRFSELRIKRGEIECGKIMGNYWGKQKKYMAGESLKKKCSSIVEWESKKGNKREMQDLSWGGISEEVKRQQI